jgi:signal recognition particle subunit SRP54
MRIAAGSGTSVPEVNQLLEARKAMEKMMGQMGRGKMPSLPGLGELPGSAPATARRSSPRKKKPKRKSGRRAGRR